MDPSKDEGVWVLVWYWDIKFVGSGLLIEEVEEVFSMLFVAEFEIIYIISDILNYNSNYK